jgi:glycosyltransferase involved in cell wall biosynthesis
MVLAGMKGFVFRACTERAEALGVGDAVSIPGWLPREELLDLYENADSFILPSLFEGFGMPLAEALAAGLPTAASDIAALREVGGDAPTYFNPLDLHAMEDALHQISFDSDFRSAAPTVGPLRASRFDWGKAAACTADILMAAARQD